jgi:hypothetical protein
MKAIRIRSGICIGRNYNAAADGVRRRRMEAWRVATRMGGATS